MNIILRTFVGQCANRVKSTNYWASQDSIQTQTGSWARQDLI